ncbi:polysaccharide deacetylase family protein [Desulfosporosinus sp. Sb-LF]|uniref:polysaccharide deacetylase family protein n=1 Tax=Desulfosporosinus sp. Sb-LF TaxID=2560027 RepID=UPI00107FCA1E|nr:polysaccharide deacetylase family protein [Desulfosporosinus sp. Sb-LF]TGE31367.1 polysaccharide deacetylase [Desulfosporosinus sp. Sb-LF]
MGDKREMVVHRAKGREDIPTYSIGIILLIMILTIGITLIIAQRKLTSAAVSLPSSPLAQSQPSKPTVDSSKTVIRPTYDEKGNPPTAPGLAMKARVFDSEPTKIVYITIDDGPYPQNTPHLLEILKKENLKATFFDVGKQIEKYPSLLKAEYEQGHSIGNHTYSHDYNSIYKSPDTFLADIQKNDDLIFKVIGIHPRIIRAPGGTSCFDIAYYNLLDANDYMAFDWNLDSKDTDGKFSIKQLVSNVDKQIGTKNKIILLIHDLPDKSSSANALPIIISHLKDKGYSFGTLSNKIMPITFPEGFHKLEK